MTLEELKQAAAESSAREAVIESIELSDEFNDTDIKNFLEILGENGEIELKDIFEEVAKNEFENNPEEEKTIELFVRAGYDLKAIFDIVWDRANGYGQLREADVFCATLAEAYISGDCGLPKDFQKACEVFEFVSELSGAWTGGWVPALSVSLDRLLVNYMKGIVAESVATKIAFAIGANHFAVSVAGSETSNIYLLHQLMVENARYNLSKTDFNSYTSRFVDGDDYVEARKALEARAETGDAIAQYNLGYCNDIGLGVAQNVAKSFQWYQKSAAQNNINAIFWNSLQYINGVGTTKDSQKGVEMLEHLAEKNDVPALVQLGIIYSAGSVCGKHLTKAKEYFTKAAGLGSTVAKRHLEEFDKQSNNSYSNNNNTSNNGGCMGMLLALITLSSSLLVALVAFVL